MYPFLVDSTIAVTGMTSSGKTRWVARLIRARDRMFVDREDRPDPPRKVLYCYGEWQSFFGELESDPAVTLRKGLPSEEDLREFAGDGSEPNLIVLDDLTAEIADDLLTAKLFTQKAHHLRLTTVYINQNLFPKGRYSVTINRNTHYTVLMKNPRDHRQLAVLASQTGFKNTLLPAYRDATAEPFGYLVVDSAPHSPDKYRLRTRVFPEEDTVVYPTL